MAGIVASTLRRKGFNRGARGPDQAKFITAATSTSAQSGEIAAVGGGNSVGSVSDACPTSAGHAASYSPSAGGSNLSLLLPLQPFRPVDLDDHLMAQPRQGTDNGGLVTTQKISSGSLLEEAFAWGTDLNSEDFWPTCSNPTEHDVCLLRFDSFDDCLQQRRYKYLKSCEQSENCICRSFRRTAQRELALSFSTRCSNLRFECVVLVVSLTLGFAADNSDCTLIPKVNSWILINPDIRVVKCETLERKVTSVDHLTGNSVMFIPTSGQLSISVKGLRLWYVRCTASPIDVTFDVTANDRKQTPGAVGSVPVEIGYMNVIPKCNEWTGQFPVYESLPETYAAINTYLGEQPLEGKILTVETVPIRLGSHHQKRPQVEPDQTYFGGGALRHTVYITRIYFIYGEPRNELIGAQDFLPDYQTARSWNSFRASYGRLTTVMRKAREWIKNAKHISVTNIQTLEAVYKKNTENVHTGSNFIDRLSAKTKLVRFLRITYTRHVTNFNLCRELHPNASDLTISVPAVSVSATSVPGLRASAGRTTATEISGGGFAYRTFTPAPVKVGMCSGEPEYESFASTWYRAKAWLGVVNRCVIGVESIVHPLQLLWQDQDGAESTVIEGDCRAPSCHQSTTSATSWITSPNHREQSYVEIVRVYLNSDYHEPSQNLLPAVPMVEEVKDCACVIV